MSIFEVFLKKEDIPEVHEIPDVSPQLQIPDKEVSHEVPIEVVNGALEELIRSENEGTFTEEQSRTIH